MVTVLLKREFRFNMANIPESIFRFAKANIIADNDEMMFDVDNIDIATALRVALESHFHRPIRSVLTGGRYELSFVPPEQPRPETQRPPQHQAAPAPEEAQDDAHCRRCGAPIDDCTCRRCEDCGALIDDCECGADHDVDPDDHSVNGFRDVVTHGSRDGILQELAQAPKLELDQLKAVIASKLDSSTSSRAKLLKDKLTQYNRSMNNLLMLKNEIESLTVLVNADPVVNQFAEKIQKILSVENPMVKTIYFTNNYLVIKTKEIITNPLKDGKKRRIGEIEFYIRLDSLFGIKQDSGYPVVIRNATREDMDHGQECGHVNLEGLPCFGTWTEPILTSLINKDFDQLVDLLFRFVRTPNESDVMGRPINSWPIVEE